jgi:membrane-bound serine protease (ClpP class)
MVNAAEAVPTNETFPVTESNLAPVQEVVGQKSAIIPVEGLIDDGLFQSIKRRSRLAIAEGAEYLIYRVETYGGLVKSADDISKYLLTIGDDVHTVAYVTTEAISAGAWISVSCKDIYMLENIAKIGDCAPVTMGGQIEGVEREKAESFIRAAFRTAAEANGYPSALLEGMVTKRIEVYRVKALETGKYRFFKGDELPDDPNLFDLDGKKMLYSSEELVTLTASEAEQYGVSRGTVEGLDDVLEDLEQRYEVEIAAGPKVYETLWSEQMVRWVNSPAVMGVLIMLAFLGLYVELNTPGLGLPGLLAVVCVVIIIASKYLVFMANWVEIAIFVMGIILLLIELFVLPGFGIAGLSGIVCIILGFLGMLIRNKPNEIPWPNTEIDMNLLTANLVAVAGGFVGFLVLAALLAKYMPKIGMFSGLVLAPQGGTTGAGNNSTVKTSVDRTADGREGEDSTQERQPGLHNLGKGSRGKALGPLRPAGKAEFDERVFDVVARGEFIDADAEVEVFEIHGNRVVVTKCEEG